MKTEKDGRGTERLIERLLQISALLSVFTTLAILGVLIFQAADFFLEVSIIEFLTDRRWTPLFTPQHFGIMPLVSGTLLVTVISLLVAVPVGLGTAIYLSEYAPDRLRRIIKPILEVLAGVPTVVYGYFALTFVTPSSASTKAKTGLPSGNMPDLLIIEVTLDITCSGMFGPDRM